MNRLLVLTIILIPVPSGAADAIPFAVPPGYSAEKIAGPPLLQHPMFACFDDRGRLYVANTAGKNLKADDLLKELPGCIRVLEDTNGDGVFDKSKIFADKLTFPMGALWHQGHVYVCSPPSLWRLTDTDGDGVCDERKELVSKFGFIGNAADIHGPWLGPDGWLYWTDGRHGHEIKQGDTTIKGKAARVFRCKLDGTNVEVVCGGGMDDPVQLAFTEEGEPFAVVDIFKARPTRQDALIYCIDGGVFPYYEAVLGEFKRTGPLLPAVSELGWVAPSGLIRYRSDHLGKEFTDTLLSTQFNQHKIVRHTLSRVGAGFSSKDEEFITSTNMDFHPTSLVEDADGSLIVIDTGGWFRIGCPQSQVAKPEIKGGLYRVRRVGAPKVEDPRGMKIDWSNKWLREQVFLLNDYRFAVRDRAVVALANHRLLDVVSALGSLNPKEASPRMRINAIWALSQMATEQALARIQHYLSDPHPRVRQVAARALGLHRNAAVLQEFQWFDYKGDEAYHREILIAAARCRAGGTSVVLSTVRTSFDPYYCHAIVHALIEMNEPAEARKGLRMQWVTQQSSALTALAVIDEKNMRPDDVLPFLFSFHPPLQDAAWHVALRHPEWLGGIAAHIQRELRVGKMSAANREKYHRALTGASRVPAIEAMIAGSLVDAATAPTSKVLLLEVIASSDASQLPRAWTSAVVEQLKAKSEDILLLSALNVLAKHEMPEAEDAVLTLANAKAGEVQYRALAMVRSTGFVLKDDLFDKLGAAVSESAPANERVAAIQAFSRIKLTESRLIALAGILSRASVLELPRLLDAFRQSSSEKVGRALLAALDKSPALANLKPADLRDVLKSYPAEVRTAAEPLLKRVAVDDAALRQKFAALDGVWKGGDIERGRHVFFSRKSLCAACHAINGEGERIAPDLSKIGAIRTEVDLLEAIVIPSSSIARGFENFTVQTKAGKAHTGVIRRETADAVHLVTPERVELRLARRDIEALEPSRESVMPQGLEATMSRQELGDLIAYLRSLR